MGLCRSGISLACMLCSIRPKLTSRYSVTCAWSLSSYPALAVPIFPQRCATLEAKLLKMNRTLENFCLMRENGGMAKKANACTKDGLRRMMVYLYSIASLSCEYQDACLLDLFWFMNGRASDTTHTNKQSGSEDAGGVFFVRIVRVKRSKE